MLNKVHEGGPLHLHRLPVSVVERQDEVEEVGLAEIGGRLLLEVSSRQGDATEDRRGERRSAQCQSQHTHTGLNKQEDEAHFYWMTS